MCDPDARGKKPHEFPGICDSLPASNELWGGNLSVRWIPVLVCAGAIYLFVGGAFHTNIMTSPEVAIVNLGRSIGETVTGAVSFLGGLIWR